MFRQTKLTDNEIKYYYDNLKKVIELCGFVSTSTKIEVTSQFPGNTLFIIRVPKGTKTVHGYAELGKYAAI